MKIKFNALFSAVTLTAGFTLNACGDNVSEVTEIHKNGMTVLLSGEDLSKQLCSAENSGNMLYVTDSATAFVCDGKAWQTMNGVDSKNDKNENHGEKGDKGDQGDPGNDGTDGKSAYEIAVKNGFTGTETEWLASLKGDTGNDGKNGAAGTSCTAKVVSKNDNSGVEISCNKTIIDTIWNGQNGTNGKNGEPGSDGAGCSLVDDGKGTVTITCGNIKDAQTVTLYKAFCGTQPFDPERQLCDQRDKQVYNIMTFTNDLFLYQTWMAENLNYAKNPGFQSWCGGGFDGGWDEGNCNIYGRLYTWAGAMDTTENDCGPEHQCKGFDGARGVCPEGWHMPSPEEWQGIFHFVESITNTTDNAGNLLKSTTGWNGSGNGENAFGFTVLPAGYMSNGQFYDLGILAKFWTTSEESEDNAENFMFTSLPKAEHDLQNKSNAFSVRCVRNN